MYLVALLALLLVATACGDDGARPASSVTPSPVTAPDPTPPATPAVQQIEVGEDVEAALADNGAEKPLELSPVADGLLVVQLSWKIDQGSLELWLDDQQFTGSSPIVGKLFVAAGATYRIKVTDGTPWDYGGLNVRFVLTTSLAPQ